MDNDDSGGVAGPDDEPQRCQMVHREVDEGLVHCDAMDAHQDHRNRCFGNAIDYSKVPRGMSVVMQSATNEAVTTRLGSQQAPASARRQARTMWLCSQHTAARGEWMCRSTQHILD